MSKQLGLDLAKTMEAFNSLMMKGFVALDSVKDNDGRLNEVIKCNERELGITQQVYYPVLTDILKEYKTKEERIKVKYEKHHKGIPAPCGYGNAQRLRLKGKRGKRRNG